MGSKKKKKSGGSGRRNKGRTLSKDHAFNVGDNGDVLSEEVTAMSAIFQEDFKVVSDSPPQFIIKIRPYSKDTESEDLSVSALLIVRCLPGYPCKCPKLQITPERGLSKDDADKLLALLHDQANFNAREGRVMIFNLVEAAQEFLSEIVPVGQSNESVSCSNVDRREKFLHGDASIASDMTHSSRGPFVYGLVDLFKSLGGPWNWGLGVDKDRGGNSSTFNHALDASKIEYMVAEKHFLQNGKSTVLQDTMQGPPSLPTVKLDALKEESEDEETSISDTSRSLVEELLGTSTSHEDKELISKEEIAKADDRNSESGSSDSLMSDSVTHDQVSNTIEKDFIMVHLLRLACASQGVLANGLPEIASELQNLGILSDRVRDLVTKPSWMFNKAFSNIFQQHMVSSPIAQFWNATTDFGGQNTSSPPSSRYLSDFEELRPLGHGGFGLVMLCRNKLDGRQYAVKKIYLKDKSPPVNNRILREVATLSRLQHQHVVRYYQAWFETEVGGSHGDTFWGSGTGASSSCSYRGVSSRNATEPENKLESTYLYIQMEYCPGTLRQVFESYSSNFQKENAWHYFRQIVEGLAHIHGQGILHRDLTPSNIFFDARNDIKIGDFGLAKFLKLEHVDHDTLFPPDTVGVSVDGTGQVGTYFYTAPEIEQGWPKIDEKVDMYSLGVVFFELWHPFGTAMERHIVLSDLKQNGALPSAWEAEFPEQASLLWRLMSPSPSDRPSATELLEKDLPPLPPQGENEWLDDILQRMQTSEDRCVYHKVVNSIFMTHQQNIGSAELARDSSSFIQYTEIDTEFRDYVVEVAKEVFRQHGAKRMEITPMRVLDDDQQFHRDGVKLLSCEGDMVELCHELRLPFVSWVMKNQVSTFIYNHGHALQMLREKYGGDLVRPGITRFATNYIALKSFEAKKPRLRAMFASTEWFAWRGSDTPAGRAARETINSEGFWHDVKKVVTLLEPLVKVLRMVDSEKKPTLPHLYAAIDMMKRHVHAAIPRGGKRYLEIIQTRWEKMLMHPMHKAAYYLNPKYQYKCKLGLVQELVDAVQVVVEKLEPNSRMQSKCNQEISSFKRYEISWVYREGICQSPPDRYLQGDFDIIGGASVLTEAEGIKATMDFITRFFHMDSCDIRLNHGDLLEAMWTWIGLEADLRHRVAELLSIMGSLRPQSPERKSKWVFIRRQLLQDLNLSEAVVNRLQTVGSRFCGMADQALPRLRGALPPDKSTRRALDELSSLCSYLRVWRIEKHVFIDTLMPPTEGYHREIFFQIYFNPGSSTEEVLLAVGGRYDQLLHQMWDNNFKSNPPGAVGTSLALESVIQHSSVETRPSRHEAGINVLICSRGGGGLIEERMELSDELWRANIKAQFVPISEPSLTEQYEYANEHDIKCLVFITDTGLAQTGSVKVRHLELKKEKEIEREGLVKFLTDAIATQFRNLSIWS